MLSYLMCPGVGSDGFCSDCNETRLTAAHMGMGADQNLWREEEEADDGLDVPERICSVYMRRRCLLMRITLLSPNFSKGSTQDKKKRLNFGQI